MDQNFSRRWPHHWNTGEKYNFAGYIWTEDNYWTIHGIIVIPWDVTCNSLTNDVWPLLLMNMHDSMAMYYRTIQNFEGENFGELQVIRQNFLCKIFSFD